MIKNLKDTAIILFLLCLAILLIKVVVSFDSYFVKEKEPIFKLDY